MHGPSPNLKFLGGPSPQSPHRSPPLLLLLTSHLYERDTYKETESRDRERDRERKRDTERDRDRDRARQRQRKTETERDRERAVPFSH